MAGKIPAHFIDELLNRVDIVDLVNSRVPLKKAGREYQACCPFHDEKTPSFTVSREKQFYHCFGCGAHGTAIGFLMEYDHAGFVEAVEELAAREGLEVPREEGGEREGPDYRPLLEILEKAARFYQFQLRRHPQAGRAIDYLKNRGLSGEICAAFGVGFAPPGRSMLKDELGTDDKALQLLLTGGMLSTPEQGEPYDRFRDRIMFPIRNHRGQVIGFGGRLLGDGKPKYLNSPETPLFHKGRELYGLYEARKALRNFDRLLVVEGYMDVVALTQYGIANVVATLGTATTPEHLEKLFRASPEVVFCFDGDRAGRDAGWKALVTALPQMRDGREVRFLFLPEGEDPDSLVRKEGSEAFNRRVGKASPLSDFLFDKLAEQQDMHSIGGKARLAEEAKTLLRQLPAGLIRKMMYQRLSQLVGIEVAEQKAPPNPRSGKTARSHLGTMPPVRRAIALLLAYPRFARLPDLPRLWRKLDLPGVPLLQELLEILDTQPNLTSAALLERWREREEFRHLNRLAAQLLPLSEEGMAREFTDTLSSLERQQLDRETEQLLMKAEQEPLGEAEKNRLGMLLKARAMGQSEKNLLDSE